MQLDLMIVKGYGARVSDHLVGLTEIAAQLGVSRQRVHQLSKVEGFPDPVARLAAGLIWEWADVERWARDTGRLTD